MVKTGTNNNNLQQLNDVVCSSLEISTPHLEFTLELTSNNLTYHKPYSKKQEVIHQLITYLHEVEGLGYRKISYKLNSWGIPTIRGKKWFNTSVHSILKRKSQRDNRIEEQRLKVYKPKLSKMSIKYYP